MDTITHTKSGASVKIHPYGATIVSFIDGKGRETLFLSKDAVMDGSKPIRGGIPLVFPIFGPADASTGSTMPQHGFARRNTWTVKTDSKYDHDEVAGIIYTLSLKDVVAGRGDNNPWSSSQAAIDGTDCMLQFEVILNGTTLTTTLSVENTGADSFNLQMLQHTYLRVDGGAALDPSQCFVEHLDNFSIIDQIHPEKSGSLCNDTVTLIPNEATDKIFQHPEADHPVLKVSVGVGSGKKICLEAAAMIAESPVPVNCVVWNPHAEKAAAMSDFGNEQYKDMICVEPGMIGHQPLLQPGKKAQLTQILLVE
eukprot:CAMPEP_0185728842 /NCGR_PEP_ID=MMETSP1171-20130828/4254_1 /TAXON_ID=374046 /ORGANISM="Helicotheca tamensis, Strain CCMP826" /LENGTH=309 /DNA_ID=CAMNT_0028397591 /DNA_START=66 /DNA_END=995 /DNA_ORIENTATION=-